MKAKAVYARAWAYFVTDKSCAVSPSFLIHTSFIKSSSKIPRWPSPIMAIIIPLNQVARQLVKSLNNSWMEYT